MGSSTLQEGPGSAPGPPRGRPQRAGLCKAAGAAGTPAPSYREMRKGSVGDRTKCYRELRSGRKTTERRLSRAGAEPRNGEHPAQHPAGVPEQPKPQRAPSGRAAGGHRRAPARIRAELGTNVGTEPRALLGAAGTSTWPSLPGDLRGDGAVPPSWADPGGCWRQRSVPGDGRGAGAPGCPRLRGQPRARRGSGAARSQPRSKRRCVAAGRKGLKRPQKKSRFLGAFGRQKGGLSPNGPGKPGAGRR